MLLAIDTSTNISGLACFAQQGLLAECSWHSGREHTAQLLPQLDLLLQHLGRTPADLRAIAVARGPGSWSGLRVGMSVAKGLALAAGLPLIGVGTLDALAWQHAAERGPIFPLIRLGRERFATAEFRVQADLQQVGAYRNLTLPELCAEISGRAFFCGDVDPSAEATLRRCLGDAAHFSAPAAALRRPGFLAHLAWLRWQANATDDLATLEPLYLGEPVKPPATPG